VQALLRYRSKCKNSPLTPIVTKISFAPFSALGAANPQTTSFPFMMFALPWAKISRRSHHPALRYPQPYKQTNKKKQKANLISRQTLRYGEIIIGLPYGEKKLWQYVKSFSSDTRTLRTDRRTDGRTDGLTDRIAISISRVSMLTSDKKGQNNKKKSQKCYISTIWGEAPTEPILLKSCMVGDVHDVITCAEFQIEIFMG